MKLEYFEMILQTGEKKACFRQESFKMKERAKTGKIKKNLKGSFFN